MTYKSSLFLYMKKSFTLLEIIFVIFLISLLLVYITPKFKISKIQLAKNQLLLHLKYVRYIAMLDDKYKPADDEWYKELWRIKFERCDEIYGGSFYTIFSDTNHKGHANKDEVLKDPLTGKLIYASSCNPEQLYNYQANVLLRYHFGIKEINLSCNDTDSLGQIIFDNQGDVYTSVKDELGEYVLDETCIITLEDFNNHKEYIRIEPNTGYIY